MQKANYHLSVQIANSRGREVPESSSRYRDDFQRDRDRIIHCKHFRKLQGKTQVFTSQFGASLRTRLTHSLEVAQIGRSVARALGLNEDLVEAICLAHDLGHAPFGHAGQDILNELMKSDGGFEHNFQSFRIVSKLDDSRVEGAGLNLMFETRLGILKHCAPKNFAHIGLIGAHFNSGLGQTLEGQVANTVDELAYNAHDLEDGISEGILSIDEVLLTFSFIREHFKIQEKKNTHLSKAQIFKISLREYLGDCVDELIKSSIVNIRDSSVQNLSEIYSSKKPLILRGSFGSAHIELKQFLNAKLYHSPVVSALNSRGQFCIERLFLKIKDNPSRVGLSIEHGLRPISDFIASLTDQEAEQLRAALA